MKAKKLLNKLNMLLPFKRLGCLYKDMGNYFKNEYTVLSGLARITNSRRSDSHRGVNSFTSSSPPLV